MTVPLSNAQLASITAGREAVRSRFASGPFPYTIGQGFADELADAAMAPLLAEIRRLTTKLAREQRYHLATVDERDYAYEMADKLAYAIAPVEVIGEHSSANCPWENAHEELLRQRAELAELRTAEPARPSPDHMAIYLDEYDQVWCDYPTVPPSDAVVGLVWAAEQAQSRADLAEGGGEMRVIGWCK